MSDFSWDLFNTFSFFIFIVYVIVMIVATVIGISDCIPKRKKYFIVHHLFVNNITIIKAKKQKTSC